MKNITEDSPLAATVTDITWERVILRIDIKMDAAIRTPHFYAVNGHGAADAEFASERLSDNTYRLSLNVTNPGNCRCLPQGSYSLLVCSENTILAGAAVSPELVASLAERSRSFLHYGDDLTRIYSVDFMLPETDGKLPFLMHVLYAKKTAPDEPCKHFKEKEIKKKKELLYKPMRGLYEFFRKFHVKKKNPTVLFIYEKNHNIDSNMTAVLKRISERGIDKDCRIIKEYWPHLKEFGKDIFAVPAYFRIIIHLASADIVFVDNFIPLFDFIIPDKNTDVINLWHAGAGFKSVGYSRWGHFGAPGPYTGHRVYTYGACGSKHIASFFSEAWGINPESVLPTGMPRLDKFLDENYRAKKTEELLRAYPCARDKKVILFAPTFRGKTRNEAHYPFEIIDFEKLYQLCADEYVVFFKMHPYVSENLKIPENMSDKFLDLSAYNNINDLFYITELLITDYSSCIYEFSLMRKPMLFFAFDEVEYSFSRGFHRDYKAFAPGKICHTFDELLKAISKKDFESEKVAEYVDRHFDIIDSNSSDRVIDWFILGKIPEELAQRAEKRKQEFEHLKELDFNKMPILVRKASPESVACAGRILKAGKIAAFPTDTVYGLGAVFTNAAAVERVFKVKGRNENKPLSVLVSSVEQVYPYAEVSDEAKKLMDAFWPGPLTVILKLKPDTEIAKAVTAGGNTIGFRMPNCEETLRIIDAAGSPLAAPSANISGFPSAVSAEDVIRDLGDSVDMIIDGGKCEIGLSSTVADMTSDQLRILRTGSITEDKINEALAQPGALSKDD